MPAGSWKLWRVCGEGNKDQRISVCLSAEFRSPNPEALFDVEFFQFVAEGREVHPQCLRGLGPVACRVAKRLAEEIDFKTGNDVVERHVLFGETPLTGFDDKVARRVS